MRSRLSIPTAALAICTIAGPLFADIASIRAAIQSGRFAEAVAACDRELQASPASAPLLSLKGLALRASGDPAAALTALRKAIAAVPSYLPALQAAAQIEFEARDPHVRGTLETVTRLAPANETAHTMLGQLVFEGRDCTRAVRHFVMIPAAARLPLARWQNGVCLFELERFRDAAGEFESLLALREHAPTRFNLALSYWRAGDSAATLTALTPLTGPAADPDTWSLLAAAHRERKEIPRAIAGLQQAVAAHPRDERLLLDLAGLCLDHNALELGAAGLAAGLESLPQSVRLLTTLGVLRVRAGELDQADALFSAAERLSPGTGHGQVGSAMILLQLGFPEQAILRLRQAANPGPMVSLTLARALLQKNPSPAERAEAHTLLTTAIATDPSNAPAHSLLGKLAAQDGNEPLARHSLEAALRLDPSDRAAAYQLMLLHRRAGRSADAVRLNQIVRPLIAREKAEELTAQRYRLSPSPHP